MSTITGGPGIVITASPWKDYKISLKLDSDTTISELTKRIEKLEKLLEPLIKITEDTPT